LADHNPGAPIGNFAPEIKGDAVEGIITFAPAGISAKADEYYGLYKAGVMNTVSVGFKPIEYEPIKGSDGGALFKEWELMELSCVAVPCDPGAIVTARSLKGDDGAAWKVGASRNLPLGDEGQAWDGPAAAASVFEHCNFDGDKPDTVFARKAFLAYDAAARAERGSYKLPFAHMVDGRLTAAPSGIRADTDIPDDVRAKARLRGKNG